MLRGRQVHVSHGKEPKTHAELRNPQNYAYILFCNIRH